MDNQFVYIISLAGIPFEATLDRDYAVERIAALNNYKDMNAVEFMKTGQTTFDTS